MRERLTPQKHATAPRLTYQILWDAPAPTPWDGDEVTPRNMLLPPLSYHTSFDHSRSNHTSVIMEIPQNLTPRVSAFQGHSRSLEPTRIDRLPMTSYECSIVTMALSRTVSEINGDICKISPPLVLKAPTEGVPLAIL